MHYTELDTPALLIDLDRLEANIANMATVCERNKVALRPHTKTHKCPEIAKLQVESGAKGITCAKLGEAEVMADAGLDDILIANQIIGELKYKRLLSLAQRARICVAVDSIFGARAVHSFFASAGQPLDVMIEINCGQNRAGVLPGNEALEFAKIVAELESLHLRGLMTHGGQSYNKTTLEDIAAVGQHEGNVMVETATLLRKQGIDVETISTGSTPTAPYCAGVPGVTEIRPGTYVFYDLTQTELFACNRDDCALSVLATVTSRPTPDRTIVDAGKKSLTSDSAGRTDSNPGYGFVLEKNATLTRLSEEHGVIDANIDCHIGEKVRILPNHVCVVVNMFDEMVGIRGGEVETTFEVAGRGKLR